MPLFKSANLLRNIIWLPSPLLQGAPSHHSNTSIRADVTYSQADFPPSVEFLNTNFEMGKKKNLLGAIVFCNCFLCVRCSLQPLFLLFWKRPGQRESPFSGCREQKRTHRDRDREKPGKPKGTRCKVGLYKASILLLLFRFWLPCTTCKILVP